MKLQIKNFCAYQTASLDLPTGLVHVFTGDTGSGKSTIIDALSWAMIGLARGYDHKKDAASFRIDPAKPMSVKVEFARIGDLEIPWPTAVNRTTSKVTFTPNDAKEGIASREAQILSCLSAWNLLGTKSTERAEWLSQLTTASGFEPLAVLREIRSDVGGAPDLGAVFNEVRWGDGWKTVGDAEANAVTIRKTYYSKAQGKVPDQITERMEANRRRIDELQTAMTSGDEPEELTALKRKAADLQQQLEQLPKAERPPQEPPVKDADFQALDERKKKAEADVERLTVVIAEVEPLFTAIDSEFTGEVVDQLNGWLEAARHRLQQNSDALEQVANRHAAMTEQLEQWRHKLQQFTQNEAQRNKLGKEVHAAEKAVENFADPRQAHINELKGELASDQKTIDLIAIEAEEAKERRGNWDMIAKSLAADGPVALALAEEAQEGIDAKRIAWASGELGIDVSLGADGTVKVNNLGERQPSRGQRLLAGLILQDAFCQAFNVPLMLVDELEAVSDTETGPYLTRAIDFLRQIVGDYETVMACITKDPAELRYTYPDSPEVNDPPACFPDGVKVWHCHGGTVQAVPDPACD